MPQSPDKPVYQLQQIENPESGKRRMIVIINPVSGIGKKKTLPGLLKKGLKGSPVSYEIAYTQYAGHASIIAAQAAEAGYDMVIAAGGDGTVNEIARSLMHSSCSMGILPVGSGNGLARHLCMPMNLEKAIKKLRRKMVISMDVCYINDEPFFCTAGVGFDAHVGHLFNQAGKRGL